MSVEPHLLGIATVGGGAGSGVALLANTGNPALVGIITGVVLVVVLGIVTRAAQRA
jgi:hypothetical protein